MKLKWNKGEKKLNRQQEYNAEFDKLKEDCLAYFCQTPVWKKLLEGFWEKYRSYGKFSGKVVLKNLTAQDIEELEGFFGKNFHGQKSVTISAEKFRKILENSRYSIITPECLLESFFGQTIIGKQAQKMLRKQQKQEILKSIRKDYEKTPIEAFLKQLQEIIKDKENGNLEEWNQKLRLGAEIYNHLPYRKNEKMYLAVFSAGITGNPHAFDYGTPGGTFLYQIIQMDLKIRKIEVSSSELFPAYKRQKSYLLEGIMIDDISNYAMLYQIQAVKKDGSMHKGVSGFYEEHQIVQVSLGIIAEWEEIHCIQNEIYIVENPSIFAMLCEKENKSKTEKTGVSYMCMNGQPRLASLLVLDLLAKTNTIVYYAGDLDPEGLLIAQKLAQYYKGEFHYWCMDENHYEKCRSKEKISAKRMKILEKIRDERLLPVVEQIKMYEVSGYQELLKDFGIESGK